MDFSLVREEKRPPFLHPITLTSSDTVVVGGAKGAAGRVVFAEPSTQWMLGFAKTGRVVAGKNGSGDSEARVFTEPSTWMLGFAKTGVGGSWRCKNGGGEARFCRTEHPVDAGCKIEGGGARFGEIKHGFGKNRPKGGRTWKIIGLEKNSFPRTTAVSLCK